MKLIAVFERPEQAQAAVSRLQGVEYEFYSAEPLHPPHVRSHLLKAGIIGGLLGGLGGMALASVTAQSMRLYTGGMPMVAFPPVGIITFALSALGAIGSVLAMLLWEAKLLNLRLPLPDDVRREVAHGAVAVTMEGDASLEETLRRAGAKIRSL